MARPRRDLSRAEILSAALMLVERDGIKALTMSKIGKAVGVEAMSLYRHVENKDEIIDGLVDLALERLVIPPTTGRWEEDVAALAHSFRDLTATYPNTASLMLSRYQQSPAYINAANAGLEVLRTAGLGAANAVHALRAVMAFVVGSLLREAGAGPTLGSPLGDVDSRREVLARLQDAPRVVEAADELALLDHHAEFDFGLRLLIDGLSVIMEHSAVQT